MLPIRPAGMRGKTPIARRLLPTVEFQEFSNEERCKAAKSRLEGSLKEAGGKLKKGMEDLKSVGRGFFFASVRIRFPRSIQFGRISTFVRKYKCNISIVTTRLRSC